jgi:hypothetical protein
MSRIAREYPDEPDRWFAPYRPIPVVERAPHTASMCEWCYQPRRVDDYLCQDHRFAVNSRRGLAR